MLWDLCLPCFKMTHGLGVLEGFQGLSKGSWNHSHPAWEKSFPWDLGGFLGR